MPFIIPAIAVAVEAVTVVGSFITTLGVVGQGIIAAGIGIASTYIISALSPKPASENVQGGVNFERQYGAQVPRQVACGLVGMAGHDIYVNTFNPSNRTLQQIYMLSDYYTTALTRVAIGGVWVIIGPDIGDGKGHILMPTTAEQTWSGSIWVKFFDGRQVAADSFLTTFANPAGRWDSSCIGIGQSFVSVLVEYDKDHNNSYPDFFFEFKGAPIYDWRKDSTNGGSGTHRWNNVATHEYTANPILIERHYRRGFSVNGDLFCGMDMQESDLPVTKWSTAANVCDELDVDDGLPRYQVSMILNSMQPHTSNLQSLSLSCGSMQIDSVDGSWPLVGTDQPVVLTFTDDDLIDIADVEFQRYKSMGELVNSVAGNYPEPEQLWSMIGYNEQIATAFLAIDRRTRDLSMDFPMVPLARQAAQLAFIYLYENRFEITATITLRPRFQVLEEGDWVTWNSAEYGTFTYIVTSKSLRSLESDGPRNVVLKLQQRDGGIYDGITPVPIVFPTPNDGPIYLTEVQSFALVNVSVQGAGGRALPAIRASWTATAPVDVTVVEIELIYYPTAQPTSILHKIIPADRTVAILDDVVSNTNYTVQAKIVTNPSRVTAFNAGATITTLNIMIGAVDFSAEILYNLTTVQDLFNDKLRDVETLLSSLLLNAEARNWNDKRELRSEFVAASGSALARISNVQTVMVDNNTAFANELHTVEASIGGSFSSVNTVSSAVALLNGYAAARYAITLDVNGYGIGFELINGGGGVAAATFTVPKFQIAYPGVAGGAAVPIFTAGLVNGVPKIGIRGDMYIDGTITGQMIAAVTVLATHIAVNQINAGHMTANSITAANAALDSLAVKTLNIQGNAVTIPDANTLTNFLGTGVGAAIFTYTVTVDTTGLSGNFKLYVSCMANKMSFTATGVVWQANLFINGTSVMDVAGINNDYPLHLTGALAITATGGIQNIVVTVNWNCSNSGTIVKATCFSVVTRR